MSLKPLYLSITIAIASAVSVQAPGFLLTSQRASAAPIPRTTQQKAIAATTDPQTGYPLITGERWDKSSVWFKPIWVNSPEGKYLAVLDKQKQGSLRLPSISLVSNLGMYSNWSRNGIRVYANTQSQVCFWALCSTSYPRLQVDAIEVKIDDQVFKPQREGDRFLVDAELAQALQTATPGKAIVRMYLKPGVTSTQPINDETVKAWATIYQEPAIPSGISAMPIGGAALPNARVVAVQPFPKLPSDSSAPRWVNDSQTGLPLVNGTTWRTRQNIPWSRLALVRDEFDGEYRAVFSRDGAFAGSWSRNFVDVFVSTRILTVQSVSSVPGLMISVGGQTLNLSGEFNRFPIDDQAARFLYNASKNPLAKPTVSYFVSKNRKATCDVDPTTVKLWGIIYQ